MTMRLRASGLLLLIGCNFSYAGLFDDEGARRQIAAQQTLVEELRGQGQALEARLGTLEETLGSQSLLELHSRMESLRLDLNRLQGQIEVLLNQNESMQKRQKDFYVDLDTRLRRIEETGSGGTMAPAPHASESPGDEPAVAAAPEGEPEPDAAATVAGVAVPSDSMPAPVGPASPVTGGINGNDVYDTAYDLFKAGRYKEAVSGFSKFVKDYPESALAPSAQYWIGNSYYALRDFKNAIGAQEKLIKNYPNSTKIPDAMLNMASSQQETDQKAAARKTLENIIARYPESDAAEKARRRLAVR